ncbi:MAG TPA: hypothetical protein VG407_13050 [Caulobacteraceae bacterium]|jgi:hypothetical protein|nr:hypothetical protein [Caulobacteraceae bacterium]
MKAAWSFTVLALLALVSAISFAKAALPKFPFMLLLRAPPLIAKIDELCLALILFVALLTGSIRFASTEPASGPAC